MTFDELYKLLDSLPTGMKAIAYLHLEEALQSAGLVITNRKVPRVPGIIEKLREEGLMEDKDV